MRTVVRLLVVIVVLGSLALSACARRQQPVARPVPPPPTISPPAVTGAPPPPTETERLEEPLPVPLEPFGEDAIGNRSLDELNRDSPLQPVYFGLDSAELDERSRASVVSNAELLKKFPTWTVTIEGHTDERGTAEYNLALGERRAVAVRAYLLSLGIPPDRVRTVSYGKEFPFDPGHDEAAWAKNRRAHFVITAK
jgi:peptidoglycan-associated lipoprotein